jgi:ribosomal protein S18 acetylase RimI-like enzyme
MKNEIAVRPMRLDDISSVYGLGRDIEEFRVCESAGAFWPVSIIEALVNSENDITLVAEDEETIVGFLIVTNHIPTKKATFENMYIVPDYRGKGVASRLYNEAEKRIRNLGMRYICGFVEAGNEKSLGYLRKNGFIQGKTYHWLIKEALNPNP